MEAILIVVRTLGALSAAGVEIHLAMRKHPRRFRYAWMMWTPLAVLLITASSWNANPLAAVATGALVGPLLYPVTYGMIWLRFGHREWQAREAAEEAERMTYHAKDFEGVAVVKRPLRATRVESRTQPAALKITMAGSRLDRATRERRSPWARGIEMGLVVGVCAVGAALYLAGAVADLRGSEAVIGEEVVAATLELNGLGAPRVGATGAACRDGRTAYEWSAVGSSGRACVDRRDGAVELWVDKRWTADRGHSAP